MSNPRFFWMAVLACFASISFAHSATKDDFMLKPGQRVMFFGDSITFDGEYGRFMQKLIERELPDQNLFFAARGSHGDTAEGSLRRVDDGVVPWKPDWVFVNLGINDRGGYSTEAFLKHYEALLDDIQTKTGARLVVVSSLFQDMETEYPKLPEFTTALQELAKRRGLLYVPLYETMKRMRASFPKGVFYAPDTTHPNSMGCVIMAEAILEALKFPFSSKPIELTIPSRQVTPDRAELPEQEFTLPLPTPVQVKLTNPPLGFAKIPRAKKAPIMDGQLSDWPTVPNFNLDAPEHLVVGLETPKRARPKTKAWATYDDNAFYFAIQVDDDVVRHSKGAGVVNRDCVELFLDLRSEAEKAQPNAANYLQNQSKGVAQFMLAPATKESPEVKVEMGNGDPALLDGAVMASSLTPTGYQIEFMIPAKHFPDGVITPGQKIGFDFSVNDLDETDVYHDVLQQRWSNSLLSSFSSREFGELELEP